MLQHRGLAGLLAVALGAASGCGSSTESEPRPIAAKKAAEAQAAAAEAPDPESVRQVVRGFLAAIQAGDAEGARTMLTPLTREKTAELGVDVAPPGSPKARFEIGEVQFKGADGAYVATQWIDDDGQGGQRADDVVWMVRRVEEGWRICGLGAKVFDDQPPLFLNFENPHEMARKQAAVEAERIRRTQAAAPSGETGPRR